MGPICTLHWVIHTTWGHDHWLKESLLRPRGETQRDDKSGPHGGAHPQAWGRGSVCLPGESLTEVERGDGFPGLSVNAGYTGTPRSAEGIVFYV